MQQLKELNTLPVQELSKQEQIHVLREFGKVLDEMIIVCKEWKQKKEQNASR